VPDLSESGAWYAERLESLRRAVATLEHPKQLYLEGLEILERHRKNYSREGPKVLQLIWWEFPVESWEAIRLGSSMNFMADPEGELKPNSPMTDEEKAVAGKFVDALIRLEVLIPAQ
jgi:hypothetical protein